MAQSDQIVFTVYAKNQRGVWETQGQAEEMHAAVNAAKKLVGSSRFNGVKVDQTFYDSVNDRRVSSTIFEDGGSRGGPSVFLWLGLAVVAGVASFGVTYGYFGL